MTPSNGHFMKTTECLLKQSASADFCLIFFTLYLSVEHPDWCPALIGLSILLSINNIPTVTSMISTWRQKKAKRNTTYKNRDTYNYNNLSDGKQNILWSMPSRPSRNSAKAKTQNLPFILPKLYIRIFFFKSQYKKDRRKIKRRFIFHRSGHRTNHTWM